MAIELPPRLDQRLRAGVHAHAVRQAAQDFSSWIGNPQTALYFFPEYTDHGPQHVSAVLAGAEWLIHEDVWSAFTAEDAAVLILAAILHDCAMHLTADGLLSLLKKPLVDRSPAWPLLDRRSWAALFADYIAEARRWDRRQINRLLGDEGVPPEQQPDLVTFIRDPREEDDPDRWSTTYRKFLGEFVRRHHPRLAHEIAFDGVPGATSPALRIAGVSADHLDLAGLVARSHGRPLRDLFAYLQKRYWGRVTCANCHPVFLAVLLRIADYLEVTSDRVNPARRKLQRLRSPISRDEWAAHLAIVEVRHPHEEDAEAVFLIGKPESAQQFDKLRRLLVGLQDELDTSWAVLGEVFSKEPSLSCLGVTLRRVRSNLDDPDEYLERESPRFFPILTGFTTAGADLLKLLVRPLYGGMPAIGVRELLQNAVDAVRELRQWAADHDRDLQSIPFAAQEVDVLIEIDRDDQGHSWLTVTDKGIGMTPETVRDYFLKAGASLRTSDAWRREFAPDGHSKVLRSGRFGIGALAAFLLGPRLEVWTRHVSERPERGIHFAASLEDDAIELCREDRDCVGTTIRVALTINWPAFDSDREADDYSLWDWYALDSPIVERRLYGRKLSQLHHFPNKDTPELSAGWARLLCARMDIHWRYSRHDAGVDPYSPYAPRELDLGIITCNGIRIGDSDQLQWSSGVVDRDHLDLNIRFPSMSIHDPEAMLPLNLRRDGFDTSLPFEDELLVELAHDLIAFLLVHAPVVAPPSWALNLPFLQQRLWIRPREGLSLWSLWHLWKAGINKVLALEGSGSLDLVCPADTLVFARDEFRPFYHENHESITGDPLLDIAGSCVRVLSRREIDKLSGWSVQGPSRAKGWYVHQGAMAGLGLLEAIVDKIILGEMPYLKRAVEIRIDSQPYPSLINRLMDDLMPSPVIPYDPALRRQKFARTYARLSDFVNRWQEPVVTGWRRYLVDHFREVWTPAPPPAGSRSPERRGSPASSEPGTQRGPLPNGSE